MGPFKIRINALSHFYKFSLVSDKFVIVDWVSSVHSYKKGEKGFRCLFFCGKKFFRKKKYFFAQNRKSHKKTSPVITWWCFSKYSPTFCKAKTRLASKPDDKLLLFSGLVTLPLEIKRKRGFYFEFLVSKISCDSTREFWSRKFILNSHSTNVIKCGGCSCFGSERGRETLIFLSDFFMTKKHEKWSSNQSSKSHDHFTTLFPLIKSHNNSEKKSA